MRGLAILGALALLTPATGDLAKAQVNTEKNISFALALTIAEAAMEACSKQGFHNSLHVVDRTGQVILAMRGDNSNPHTFENSRRKAYTAKTLGVPTSEFARRLSDPATAIGAGQQATLPGMIGLAGGIPIKAGDDVIGAVALSGSPKTDLDEDCARAGVAKVADQLK